MSKLVEGKIPVATVCPFLAQCPSAESGVCHHKGTQHEVAYSCASARAYDLIESVRSPNKMRGAFA